MYCLSTYVPEKCLFLPLFFTLRSKVGLILTRATGTIIAQSAQFSKIVKKLNIDSCQFFSHWKEALVLLKSWNKIWSSPYSFLRQSCRKYAPHAFSPIFERGSGASFRRHLCGRGKKVLKNPFLQNLHRDITVRAQCDKDGAWMKIKVS